MRRKDREQTREYAETVLDRSIFGTLAMIDPAGKAYCVSLSFVREGNTLYFHCAKEGKKIDCLRHAPEVCVSFVCSARVPRAKFTIDYESAVGFGLAEEVLARDEKVHALELLCQHYTPDNMGNFAGAVEKALEFTSIWKIELRELSGKAKTSA